MSKFLLWPHDRPRATFPHEQVQGIVCAAILTALFSAALRRHQ